MASRTKCPDVLPKSLVPEVNRILRILPHKGDKPQPWYFTDNRESILSVAGLWDEWNDKDTGKSVLSCTMAITESNAFVAEVHDRMPVLLRRELVEDWLSGKNGKEALVPASGDVLRKWPVSKRVNSSRADDEDESLIRQHLPARWDSFDVLL